MLTQRVNNDPCSQEEIGDEDSLTKHSTHNIPVAHPDNSLISFIYGDGGKSRDIYDESHITDMSRKRHCSLVYIISTCAVYETRSVYRGCGQNANINMLTLLSALTG